MCMCLYVCLYAPHLKLNVIPNEILRGEKNHIETLKITNTKCTYCSVRTKLMKNNK